MVVEAFVAVSLVITPVAVVILFAVVVPSVVTPVTLRVPLDVRDEVAVIEPPRIVLEVRVVNTAVAALIRVLRILDAVNDVAVSAFLNEQIRWIDIPSLIETVLSHHRRLENPSLEQILELDCWAREEATRRIEQLETKSWVS